MTQCRFDQLRSHARTTFELKGSWRLEAGDKRQNYRVLISPYHDQEGNKLMFLSEWREFHSVPCLAGKKKLDDSSRLGVVEIARVSDMFPNFFPSWSG